MYQGLVSKVIFVLNSQVVTASKKSLSAAEHSGPWALTVFILPGFAASPLLLATLARSSLLFQSLL